MRSRIVPLTLLGIIIAGIIVGAIYFQTHKDSGQDTETTAQTTQAQASPMASPSTLTEASPSPGTKDQNVTNTQPDLTVDANGLSKATVVITTNKGVIKYKFYSKDAPETVNRMVALINQGFYNNLTFHRVVPGFVVQGGDPLGNGTGGSGQKLKAEFNNRRHIEGTVAMARAQDPDSADSQFYITLGPQPQLDRSYTVFGQVVEGMDVVKKLEVGDKMTSVVIQ
jgi:cyclophilin family peptidyl-prolyl cis-trans isomerase